MAGYNYKLNMSNNAVEAYEKGLYGSVSISAL